jgi:hypothetical protein
MEDLLTGFGTDFVDKVNGDIEKGTLNVNNVVTPLSIHWKGPTSDRAFTLLTGEEDINMAGVIHHIDDDGPEVRLNDDFWTGSEWQTVKFSK